MTTVMTSTSTPDRPERSSPTRLPQSSDRVVDSPIRVMGQWNDQATNRVTTRLDGRVSYSLLKRVMGRELLAS